MTSYKPTVDVFEKRMAALEGGAAALATAFVPRTKPLRVRDAKHLVDQGKQLSS